MVNVCDAQLKGTNSLNIIIFTSYYYTKDKCEMPRRLMIDKLCPCNKNTYTQLQII